MRIKTAVLTLASAAVLSTAGLAFAQQSSKPAPGMQGGKGGSMDHGMMGGGGMMGGHHGMMGGMMMVPQMPPGNERLEFQMRAEMMQKMGEIAAKYASQIKEGSR